MGTDQDLLSVHLRALANHVADVACLADTDRRITWIADTVEESLGWSPDDLIGTGLLDLLHPDDVTHIAAIPAQASSRRPTGFDTVTVRLRSKEGDYRWFSGRGVPVLDQRGRPAGIAAGLRRVDDLIEERERARSTEHQVRMVLDGMLDPHLLLEAVPDGDGDVVDLRFSHVNREASRLLDVRPEDLLGRTMLEWRPQLQDTDLWAQALDLFRAGSALVLDNLRFPDGFVSAGHFFDIRAVRIGEHLSCVFRDVTARHQDAQRLSDSERRFRLLAENTSDVVVTVRQDGSIDWASPAAQDALGMAIDEVLERDLDDLVHPEDRDSLREAEGAEVRLGGPGHWRWMRLSRRILLGDGSVTVYTAQDIQAEMDARNQLAHELGHDPLTGLPNRSATLSRLRDLLRSRHRRESLALFAIGIDDLRSVNEAFSYAAGDRVISQVARRLLAYAGSADDVSRVGDNEFTLVVRDVQDVTALADLASGLQAELPSATTIDGHQIRLTVSIGIAMPDSPRALDLLRDATSALHHARAKGGNRWEYLDSAQTHAARERLILRSGIHEALDSDQIRPWFQPVVTLADGARTGYEALARWVQPDGTVVLPGAFIPVAESTDLIVALDRHMMRKALTTMAALDWPAQLGINVSAASLSEPDFGDSVQDELERSGYPPELLHLEVTETALLNPTAHVQRVMRELAALGVTWWVDDFGTGYSSITHIRDLPVQGLKLDCSFTAGLPDDVRAVRLAQGLMGLANGLRMRTTAEGVETPEQAALLAEQGWELGQGWMYGRPAATP